MKHCLNILRMVIFSMFFAVFVLFSTSLSVNAQAHTSTQPSTNCPNLPIPCTFIEPDPLHLDCGCTIFNLPQIFTNVEDDFLFTVTNETSDSTTISNRTGVIAQIAPGQEVRISTGGPGTFTYTLPTNPATGIAPLLTVVASTTTQLLANPGFESGQSPWRETSTGGFQIVDTVNPHTGADSAFICGYNNCVDEIFQAVTIPSTTTKIVLSYWLFINTQETGTTCFDNFAARIRTTTGTTITTVQTKCNANASGWTQFTFDLTSALSRSNSIGQTVEVYFTGNTDSSLITNFFVDDVAFNATHS